MPNRNSRLLPWLLTAAWAAAIFAVSARPGSTLPGGYSVQGHLIEYFVLGALLVWALAEKNPRVSVIAAAVALASLYGVTDEIHQHFVPMRTPDVFDWMLDTAGAAAGASVAWALLFRSRRGEARRQRRSGA